MEKTKFTFTTRQSHEIKWPTQQLRQSQKVLLNENKTDSDFLQYIKSNTTVCLIIHMFCKSCEPEIVFVLICTLAEQFHVHKSYKMHESTLLWIGNLEENINLSHIHLAVVF